MGDWNEDTERLYMDLKEKFHYLSDVTAYHFLMDIGAFCIKPDRQIVALLELLDKVGNNPDAFFQIGFSRFQFGFSGFQSKIQVHT